MGSIQISCAEEIVKLSRDYKNHWFRGHSTSVNKLVPRIFRPEYVRLIEESVYAHFKLEAPAFHSPCPGRTDFLDWLFLMQHHGLPTRLLDWTKSPLIATLFSVYENISEDGELWILDPLKLNRKSGLDEFPLWGSSPLLADISGEAFVGGKKAEKIRIEHGELVPPRTPLAILPQVTFERMYTQQSCFTIHPEKSRFQSMEVEHADCITRCTISREVKPDLLKDLYVLGIKETLLFPSLDGLARHFVTRYKVLTLDSGINK